MLAVHRPRRAGRTARRVALLGALTAAVAGGLVVLPSFTGGDQAFGTWTAAPTGMSAQQRAAAAIDCRQNQQSGAGADSADDLIIAEPAIAERRGVWTTVVLVGGNGFAAMSIIDDSAGLFTDGMIGSIGTPADYAAPGPRELFATRPRYGHHRRWRHFPGYRRRRPRRRWHRVPQPKPWGRDRNGGAGALSRSGSR